jgi:peptidoglycan hydrolase-like protein with peptidoglycan-binding domain
MRARGWAIPANGVYDAIAARACRLFQQEKGLVVDAIVGPRTWRAAWTEPIT